MQRIICIHFHAKKILINEFGIQEGKNNKKEKIQIITKETKKFRVIGFEKIFSSFLLLHF